MPEQAPPAAGQQIPLDLGVEPDFSAYSFVAGASNAEALAALGQTDWSGNALAICGPKDSGKTHLGHVWAGKANAICLTGQSDFSPLTSWQGRALWIDAAAVAQEFTLFTVVNMALNGQLSALLLTDRRTPSTWPVQIPDLKSRLNNVRAVAIDVPDDTLLADIVYKLFLDRGLKVDDTLVSFLLSNTERSIEALRRLILELDQAAAIAKVNVTRNFAAKYLQGQLL